MKFLTKQINLIKNIQKIYKTLFSKISPPKIEQIALQGVKKTAANQSDYAKAFKNSNIIQPNSTID